MGSSGAILSHVSVLLVHTCGNKGQLLRSGSPSRSGCQKPPKPSLSTSMCSSAMLPEPAFSGSTGRTEPALHNRRPHTCTVTGALTPTIKAIMWEACLVSLALVTAAENTTLVWRNHYQLNMQAPQARGSRLMFQRAAQLGAGQIQVYQAILMSDLVACLQQI
ncbi:unnamed protein product [Gadus morhua 'NCC']